MIITLGSFDGVHLGHRALINRTIQEAQKRRLPSCALVFKIPPRMILSKDQKMTLLTTPDEKDFLLRKSGIQKVDLLEFGKSLSQVPGFIFLREELIKKRRAKGIVIGHDFRFGAGRAAGALELVRWGQEFEIPVWVISPIKKNGKIISSTLIREYLLAQRYQKAVNFLGHPYVIAGRVVKGQSLGKKLGFPTANVEIKEGKLVPHGVFVVRIHVGKKQYKGVCNIGFRPTLGRENKLTVEPHLFGYSGSLKGKNVVLELLSRIRSEKRFASLKELTQAIRRDVSKAKLYFSRRNSV